MIVTKNHTVAECVAKNYQTAPIFKKYKIDFCCGGNLSIHKACKPANVDETSLLQELNEAMQQNHQENIVETYELDALADHIVQKHHSYVRQKLPEIDQLLDKIVGVHEQKHPELQKVQEIFLALKKELLSHMQKEEDMLFPYIKEMVEARKNETQLVRPFFGTINESIKMREIEHESAGNSFKGIKELTNDLTPPDDACNAYRVTFSLFEDFENDLHRHIHLENNVLFPKAKMLGNDLSAK